MLTPIAAVEAQPVFTPGTSAFFTTTSGQPEYAGSYGTEISSSAIAGGAGIKLWGDSGVRTRDSFSYMGEDWEGPEVRYRDGLTFAWKGTFTGTLTGPGYVEGEWQDGDRLAVNYDFRVERTYLGSGIEWEIRFVFDGYDHVTTSGSLSGDEAVFQVTGTALGSSPLTWNDTPTLFEDTSWAFYLMVKPSASALEYNWGVEDTLRVVVPGNSIDFGINSVPSAIPEPSTWALILGAGAFGVVVIARRKRLRE